MEYVRTALTFLVVLLEVILVFNLLIVVHELGHFLAARWRGLVIEKFGIWFGKPLWKKTVNGVQYSLGSIPFGGFVALPQMAPMEVVEGESASDRAALPPVSPWDKIIVAIAGPLFSFMLAIVFAFVVWLVGRPVSEAETSLVIGYVLPDSPAASAPCNTPDVPKGLRPGDRIVTVDGHAVTRFHGLSSDSVVWNVVRSEGPTIPFEVRRGDQTLTFQPTPLVEESPSIWQRKGLREVLIEPAFTCIVAKIESNSPAEKAGLRENDVITAANGVAVLHPAILQEVEQDHYGEPVELTVERDKQPVKVTLPPIPFKIGAVTPGSPADRAGIKKNDVILTINGAPAARFSQLRETIAAHPDQAVALTISQDGQTRSVSLTALTPKRGTHPIIGIAPSSGDGIDWANGGRTAIVTETPFQQVYSSVMTISNTLGAVIAPKSHIGVQQLGGPVMIGRTYFYLLTSPDGWRLALWFSVVLNVNLALLNMLPIPVLDGGHILLALIEWVRRRPVNLRLLEVIQTACFILIAGYMLYVSFYDVGDLASGRKSHSDVEFPSPTQTPAPAKP